MEALPYRVRAHHDALRLSAFARHFLESTCAIFYRSYCSSSPPVKVPLRTSWPSPPFLLELIETISLEEPDTFFPLLDVLTSPDAFPAKDKLSPEAQQQLALQTALSAGYLSKPGALEAVQAQLAVHAANPKIVAFYEHYTDNAQRTWNDESRGVDAVVDAGSCGSWVDWLLIS